MNKGTIITDAIAYVEELQKSASDLTNQLLEMEATLVEESKMPIEAIDAAEKMQNWGIKVYMFHTSFEIFTDSEYVFQNTRRVAIFDIFKEIDPKKFRKQNESN